MPSCAFAVALLLGAPAMAQIPGDAAAPAGLTAPVVKADAAAQRQTAFWTENGKPMAARGADVAKAPQDATVIDVKVFDLGGGQNFREITIRKDSSFNPPKGADALIYVLKGRLQVKLGAATSVVGPGDSFRKVAALDNTYTALEETVILETDAPPLKN
jgi:hypothetical protein